MHGKLQGFLISFQKRYCIACGQTQSYLFLLCQKFTRNLRETSFYVSRRSLLVSWFLENEDCPYPNLVGGGGLLFILPAY